MGDRPGSYSRVRTRHVLVCEDSLCPRKQPDVSGPSLGEAGRYMALAPRTSRRATALLHAPCSSIRAHILPLRQGGKPAPAAGGGGRPALGGGRRRQGASSMQGQRICLMLTKHMTALRQGVPPRAPKVMLDDAVQAHLGRLRLRRL